MKVTLEDLLHAINICGEEYTILVDCIDEITVCPPLRLTKTGRNHFQQALTANVVVEYDKHDNHELTNVSDDDEEIEHMAWDFLNALAGFCCHGGYDSWFVGEDSEMI